MSKPTRRWLVRGILGVVGLLVLAQGGALAVLAWPEPFFPFCEQNGRFKMCSDAPLRLDTTALVAEIEGRATPIQIHDPRRRYRVFLCSTRERFATYARLAGLGPNAQGLSSIFTDTIFLNLPLIDEIRLRFGPPYQHTMLAGELPQILLHEIVHRDLLDALGPLHLARTPRWKREGYCEYASTLEARKDGSTEGFRARAHKILSPEHLPSSPIRRLYARGQILVEYLAEIRGWGFAEIMAPEVQREDVLRQLERFLAEQS